MKRASNFLAVAAVMFAALISMLAPGASAQTGSISGVVLDVNEKPWVGLTVQAVSDQGFKQEAKTDDQGRYNIRTLRPGAYDVTITTFPPPNDKQPPFQIGKVRVQNNEDAKADANFKQILAKQGAATQEAAKKQEEEKQKFQGMKQHFEAGVAEPAREALAIGAHVGRRLVAVADGEAPAEVDMPQDDAFGS